MLYMEIDGALVPVYRVSENERLVIRAGASDMRDAIMRQLSPELAARTDIVNVGEVDVVPDLPPEQLPGVEPEQPIIRNKLPVTSTRVSLRERAQDIAQGRPQARPPQQ